VRERDTTEQVRVPAADLPDLLAALRAGDRRFDDLGGEYASVETDVQRT
jgi:glycyl-tRNA synthetase